VLRGYKNLFFERDVAVQQKERPTYCPLENPSYTGEIKVLAIDFLKGVLF